MALSHGIVGLLQLFRALVYKFFESFEMLISLKSQTSVLFLSSIIGVGLGLLSSVLNTRFLTPEEYGNYRYVYNIISFISSLLLFGYFVSGCRLLAISKDQEETKRINGAMVIILAITSVSLIIVMVLASIIQKSLNDLVSNLFLISLPVCAAPLFLNYINTTFQGENKIKELAVARLLPYATYLPIGFLWYTSWGSSAKTLMLLQNGCAIVVYIILIVSLKPKFENLKPIFKLLKQENRDYGFHVYIGSILAVSLGYVSGITLGLFEDNNVNVGFYTLALTVVTPLSLLPTIVGTTHFKEFANRNFIDRRVIRNTIVISLISLTLFVLLIVPLVKVVYSSDYAPVGYYACFIAVGMIFHGLGDMYNRFLGAHALGRQIRNGAIITGFVQLAGSIILVYYWGIVGAIITKILSSAVYYSMMIYYYKRFSYGIKS